MRILHLLASSGWGGAERVACTIHRIGREHGCESRIEAPALPEILNAIQLETGESLQVQSQERGLGRWVWAARRRVREYNPDVVHAHLATPSFCSAVWAIASEAPLVCTFHLLPVTDKWSTDYLLPFSSRHVVAQMSRRKRRIRLVAVSESDRDRLQRTAPALRAMAVINAPPLRPVSMGRTFKPLGRPGTVRLLSVGRLHVQKGFDRMIAALGNSSVRELNWSWTIVGEGDARADLEVQIHRERLSDRVSLVGSTPAYPYFEQADLVLCPSRFEGMPLVPLEAMEAGVPIVGSSIQSHIELFRAAPSAILSDDERLWHKQLLPLIVDLKARERLAAEQSGLMGSNPRERVWEEYRTIYQSLL